MSTPAILPLAEEPFQLTVDEVVARLNADAKAGLSQGEAVRRLAEFGANELAHEPPTPAWRRFLAQFGDTLVILLIIAAGISAVLWAYEREAALPYEALAIFGVVLLNAILGFVQEARAEAAVAALRAMTADQATVVRDGERRTIPATSIVPGDVVLLDEGDTIPADGRLLESAALQTAEAALTGESLPVSKDTEPLASETELGDRTNMVFSGTIVTYGHGLAVVTATGMHTAIGQVASILSAAKDEATPLERELDRVGKLLGMVVIVIAVVMVATIVIIEDVQGASAWFDVLILGVALAVAAVPEGLPAVVTAVLALGVQRMAHRKAIVRHLSAVEALGSADVIASDKTGTLTRNEMTVRTAVTASGRATFTGTGYEPAGELQVEGNEGTGDVLQAELTRALTVADRANNASLQYSDGRWSVLGDPTEGALIVAARKAGLEAEDLENRLKRVGEVPFSSERKLMSTIHHDVQSDEHSLIFTKGAPDVLLSRCSSELVGQQHRPLSDDRRREILRANEQLAEQALRTLAVAARHVPQQVHSAAANDAELEQELTFLGLIGMIDPPREEARQAVARASGAGIRSLMITGDHPKTAAVIAGELGISQEVRVITGAELEKMSQHALEEAVQSVSVYARVNPSHKLRIVDALKAAGHTVAMTGDGVNDAPALKAADIGVAMGVTGTDVSKEAADVILTDDNFATIVAAVEEGRAIFDNIRKFLRYLLSSNIGEVLTMFFGVLLGKQLGLHAADGAVVLPLLATQILWINLMTDGAPALALGVDPPEPDLMSRPPRPPREGVLTGRMWAGIVFVGVVMAVGTLAVLDASLAGGLLGGDGDLRYGQTMAFTTLMLFQLFNVFNARSDDRSAFKGLFHNAWLWGAVAISLLLQLVVVYVPWMQRAFSTAALSGSDWMFCTAVASSVLWLRELSKLVTGGSSRSRRRDTQAPGAGRASFECGPRGVRAVRR